MKLIDLQDVALLAGVLSLVTGIAMWSIPAALIAFGLLCLAFVWLIEASKNPNKEKGRGR